MQKTNKKSSNKARRSRRRKRASPKKGRGRFWDLDNPSQTDSFGGAPVAISDYLQQRVSFKKGSSEGSLVVSATIPLYQICSNAKGLTGVQMGGFLNADIATTGNVINVELSSTGGETIGLIGSETIFDYISPVFKLLGNCFVRYQIKGLKFIYEPQSTTTVEDRLVFAYANDPNHPMIGPGSSQANLLALSDSVAFAPWKGWSLDVTTEVSQNLLYTASLTNSPLDDRFIKFGAIGCLGTFVPTVITTPTVYGILYARLTIEFREFCPLLVGFTPTLSSALPIRPVKEKAGKVKVKEIDPAPCESKKCNLSNYKSLHEISSKELVESHDESDFRHD